MTIPIRPGPGHGEPNAGAPQTHRETSKRRSPETPEQCRTTACGPLLRAAEGDRGSVERSRAVAQARLRDGQSRIPGSDNVAGRAHRDTHQAGQDNRRTRAGAAARTRDQAARIAVGAVARRAACRRAESPRIDSAAATCPTVCRSSRRRAPDRNAGRGADPGTVCDAARRQVVASAWRRNGDRDLAVSRHLRMAPLAPAGGDAHRPRSARRRRARPSAKSLAGAAETVGSAQPRRIEPPPPPQSGLPFPLPVRSGVYAGSNGQLIELEPLPVEVPRLARYGCPPKSPEPSRAVSGDRLTFVVFRPNVGQRRPAAVSARVVARVSRAITFVNLKAKSDAAAKLMADSRQILRIQGRAGRGQSRDVRHPARSRPCPPAATRWCWTAAATISPWPDRSPRRSNAWSRPRW